MAPRVALYHGPQLARYGFPDGHPLGEDRQAAFLREAQQQGLLDRAWRVADGRPATRTELLRFHTSEHLGRVAAASTLGTGYLDQGDTPAFPGVYDAAACVVGAALDGLDHVIHDEVDRSLQAIGGLHHARPDRAAGFCVFNDLGVLIQTLRRKYHVTQVAYVDIDVHHGDGIYYPFEADPELIFADIHQDGRTLYPGTGSAEESGSGAARGTKLNLPLPRGAGDAEFLAAWDRVLNHLQAFRPEFLVFQCGADGLAGDPIAGLRYSPAVHARAARDLCLLANQFCGGRIMAFGGGGYDRGNLARAWSAVLKAFLETPAARR